MGGVDMATEIHARDKILFPDDPFEMFRNYFPNFKALKYRKQTESEY